MEENAVNYVQRREQFSRALELYLWLAFSGLVSGRGWIDFFSHPGGLSAVLAVRYLDFLAGFLVLVFPLVYRLIFGALPLESARRKRAQRQLESIDLPMTTVPSSEIRVAEIRLLSDSLSTDELASSPATRLFAYYASSSRRLSQSLYSRAGVYLLVGVFVAFSGLAFFYSQTAQFSALGGEGIALLISLAPKFGILFFIEIVAFFFLRQYRAAMDEFRYYEAIKRNREETLALIRIATDSNKPLDPIEFIKNDSFFSTAGTLSKGQSTEILESRKLEKSELDILEKVIDLVSRSKK